MTDKMLEQKKQALREEMNAKGFGWIDGKYIKPPKEYKMQEEELSCIDMINSILAYDWFGESAEWVMEHEEKKYYNYLEDYVDMFGRDRVVELIQGQIDSIRDIKRNVHVDNEGVSYNSIIWRED
jgi:hypothetical protein